MILRVITAVSMRHRSMVLTPLGRYNVLCNGQRSFFLDPHLITAGQIKKDLAQVHEERGTAEKRT